MNEHSSRGSGLASRAFIGGIDGLPGTAETLLLGARVYAGVTIASAGLDKLPVPLWMEEQVAQMGLPAVGFFALVACLTEFAGGILLALGVLTRPSAALLAFTMGMAAFRFHGVPFITGMHIAQGFFWLFVVFVALGGGRLSLDHVLRRMSHRSPGPALAAAAILALVPTAYGLYLDFGPQPPPQEPAPVEITAVSVPGSFNDWDLTTHPLEPRGDGTWAGTIHFEEAGPIAFKFAANGSWAVNFGDDDPETTGFPRSGTVESGGENIPAYIAAAGAVRFMLDPATGAYRVGPAAEGAADADAPEGE